MRLCNFFLNNFAKSQYCKNKKPGLGICFPVARSPLICSALICSFLFCWKLLISKSNSCSFVKSYKSKSLLSLFKKEQCEWFALSLSKNERFAWKKSNFCMFLTVFHCFSPLQYMPKRESLPLLFALSLFFKKQRKWFPVVALYKRAKVRKSLKSSGAICSFQEQIAISLFCSQKKSDSLKTKERFPNPARSHNLLLLLPHQKKIEPGNHFKKQSCFSLFIIRNIC